MKTKLHSPRGGRSAVVVGCLTALFAVGCGGNDDGSGTGDPLIEEGSNVIPSGTGPGTAPVPPADSTITGNPGVPAGGAAAGQPGMGQDSTP